MATIFDSGERKIRRVDNLYKVYDEAGDRIARLPFGDNDLTDTVVLHILRDRFKSLNPKNKNSATEHVLECLESALLAVEETKIKRVVNHMSKLGYCELQVDLGSGTKLLDAIIPEVPEGTNLIALNKLHCTIMYDERDPDISPDSNNRVYKGKITGVQLLGKEGTKYRSVALLLDAPAIEARFKELLKLGFEHSYDDLLVHVSTVYGPTAEAAFPIIEKLFEEGKLPEYLTLCNESWDQLNDD